MQKSYPIQRNFSLVVPQNKLPISLSIVEIENHSKKNTEFSREAKKISSGTLEIVNRGNLPMEEMHDSMNQTDATSMDVTKIIKVINEIAFQTNLLVLNAAVEAVRAGSTERDSP